MGTSYILHGIWGIRYRSGEIFSIKDFKDDVVRFLNSHILGSTVDVVCGHGFTPDKKDTFFLLSSPHAEPGINIVSRIFGVCFTIFVF